MIRTIWFSEHPPLFRNYRYDVALIGNQVDQRGVAAINIVSPIANTVVRSTYEPHEMFMEYSETNFLAHEAELIGSGAARKYIVEATTLGTAELFNIIYKLKEAGAAQIDLFYIEPKKYVERNGDFKLTDKIREFLPIPPASVSISSDERCPKGIIFLGFEGMRFQKMLSDFEEITGKECSVVYGVPPFSPGWENYGYQQTLDPLKSLQNPTIRFCGADNPVAAFNIMESIKESLGVEETMFVSPLGTKPHGIAAAAFAAHNADKVCLLYDHPVRSHDRTEEIRRYVLFRLSLQ